MKRLLILIAFSLALTAKVYAKEDTKELPIGEIGKAFATSVSTTDWTVIESTITRRMQVRSGIKVSNPATNSYVVYGILSRSTPTEATSIRPIEIQAGENPFIPLNEGISLYLISPSGAQTVYAQEVKQ